MAKREPWPSWTYFPANVRPPRWVEDVVAVVAGAADTIATVDHKTGLTSDHVLRVVAPGLTALGFAVESGKSAAGKLRRPVLFGDNGVPTVSYEVDAVHDELGIVFEVEAGRGARGNATYRDLIRASLILDARYLALMVPITYRYSTGSVPAYRDARDMLAAIYASRRLTLPFEGVCLIGY